MKYIREKICLTNLCCLLLLTANILASETVFFTKADSADWTLEENQDRITDNVWITRKHNQSLFNIAQEDGYSGTAGSPIGTLWANTTTAAAESASYTNFVSMHGGSTQSIINNTISLYLPQDDLYFDVVFTSYTGGNNGGGFSYSRTSVTPTIALSPDSLSADLYTGDSLDQVLTISNNGLSDLIFEIDVSAQRQQQPRRPNNNQVISRNKQLPLEDFMNVISNGYRQNSDSQERQSNKTISEGGSRPPNSTSTRSTNENRSWQLLYTDPDEPDINIDVQNVYGDVSNDEVLLKWDSYVEWIDPVGNGITILYVDADQDTSTCLLYTSPSPRDLSTSRMPSSA